jgi:hypothetical protein
MSTSTLGALLHMPEINDEVERELSSIRKDCYQTVVPRLVASVSSRLESSTIFLTDESKGEVGTGFGAYQLNGGETVFVCGNQVVSSHQNCRQFLWPWSKSVITTLVN